MVLYVTKQHLETVLLLTTAVLFVVQTPVDLKSHRLLRLPTISAVLVVVSVYVAAFLLDLERSELAPALVVSVAVSGVAWLMHQLSPRSLGWGDVLLVVPLVLAVSFQHISQTPLWFLLASISAALHGLVRFFRKHEKFVPFGPHLIGAASAVLLVSL